MSAAGAKSGDLVLLVADKSIAQAASWGRDFAPLRGWLKRNQHWPEGVAKPPDPKAAMEAAMRARRRPKSASTFRQLGSVLPFEECADRAFQKLRDALREWFPAGERTNEDVA